MTTDRAGVCSIVTLSAPSVSYLGHLVSRVLLIATHPVGMSRLTGMNWAIEGSTISYWLIDNRAKLCSCTASCP